MERTLSAADSTGRDTPPVVLMGSGVGAGTSEKALSVVFETPLTPPTSNQNRRPLTPGSGSVGSETTFGTNAFLDPHNNEIDIFMEDLKQLEIENENQKMQLRNAESSIWRLQTEINQLRKERDDLRLISDENEQTVESLRQKTARVDGLDASLKTAITEIDRLKRVGVKQDDPAERDLELEKMRLKVVALQFEADSLREKVKTEKADKERIKEVLESQVEKMLSKINNIEERRREEAALDHTCEGLRQPLDDEHYEVQRLRDQLMQKVSNQEAVWNAREEELLVELTRLRSELEEANRELLEATLENQRIRTEAKEKINQVESELSESNDDRSRLRSSISRRRSVPQDEVTKAVSQAVESRDQQLKELKLKIAHLSQTAKAASEEQSWTNARLKVSEEESKLLQTQLTQLQAEADQQIRMAQTESSNAKAESTRLKQLLDKMQNENRSLKANLEAHREKCGKMRNEAAGFEASIQALRAKLKATEIELRERQSELEASEAAVTDLVLELAEGKRLNECLRTEKGEENTNGLEEELLRIPESIKMSVNGMLFTEHPRDDQEKFVAGACEIVASPFLNQRSVPEERERCSDNYELASAETQGTVVEGSGESERNIVSNVEVLTRFSKKDCSTSEIGQDVLSNEIADATKLTTYSDRTNAMYDKETSDDRNVAKTWSLDSMEEHIHSWPRSWHANDGLSRYGGRDAIGYGVNVPKPMWPNMAKVALNFVINFEEGGERCILHGDGASKRQLSSLARAEPVGTDRHLDMESLYDYGSRSGFWRLHRLFASKQITCTVFAVGMALERNPQACQAMKQAGWEVASHGYRLADYNVAAMDIEKQHIDRTIGIHQKLIGDAPAGMFLGTPSPSTRGLVSKKFYYDSDSYSDELPFWTLENGSPHLVIPSAMNLSDTRFLSNGFGNAQGFFRHLTETLDTLLAEGRAGQPKMMTVDLHCRMIGKPGLASGLAQFVDYAKSFGTDVWICSREDIARFWYDNFYPMGAGKPVGTSSKV